LEAVFSVGSVPKLYYKDERDKRTSVEKTELEEWEVVVRWPPACEDVSPGTEEPPLLEDVTQQRSEDRGWEH
jgi:hypothetical protein